VEEEVVDSMLSEDGFAPRFDQACVAPAWRLLVRSKQAKPGQDSKMKVCLACRRGKGSMLRD
jgi:hypothetical protein